MQGVLRRQRVVSLLRPAFASSSLSPSQGVRSVRASATASARRGKTSKGTMPNGVKKGDLPSKVCVVCNRPFTWRKKWERCWDEVTTCSKKCNGIRRRQARRSDGAASGAVVADGPLDGDTGGSHRQAGQKECTMCARPVDLLIRCTIDVSGRWEMVCGRCWRGVSGGVTDGDAAHPFYRYGGLWKNRKARTHTVGV